MSTNTETTLDAVHDGIKDAITAAFPAFALVDTSYRQDRKALPTPACLIELADMEVAEEDDPGSEQLAMWCTFEARVIIRELVGVVPPRLAVRKLAASLAAFVRLKRWGCPIGPAMVQSAAPDDFSPELDQYEVWRVEWRQLINIGTDVWADMNDGTPPSQVLVSTSPQIGIPYEPVYQPVTPP